MSTHKPDLVEWSAGLVSAQELLDAGETVAARLVLSDLISFVDRTWGPDDVHLLRPLRLIAASYFLEHEPLDPENTLELEYLQRALMIARRRLGNDHGEVASLTGEVGGTLLIAGSIDDACALMIECLEIAGRIGESDSFTRYFFLLGDARMGQGRFEEAVGFFEQAVRACERNRPSSASLASAHLNLGKCHRELGRSKQAIVELELALSIAKTDSDLSFIARIKREIELTSGDP